MTEGMGKLLKIGQVPVVLYEKDRSDREVCKSGSETV